MLSTDGLKYETGLETDAWPFLLEEAERYGYDDEKVKNIAWGFKLGQVWVGQETDKAQPDWTERLCASCMI